MCSIGNNWNTSMIIGSRKAGYQPQLTHSRVILSETTAMCAILHALSELHPDYLQYLNVI